MKTNTCPICGSAPIIESRPLWHGDHGYKNSYDYSIACTERECPMSLVNLTVSTLNCSVNGQHFTGEELKHKLINKWNAKCDAVQELLKRR